MKPSANESRILKSSTRKNCGLRKTVLNHYIRGSWLNSNGYRIRKKWILHPYILPT